MAAFDVLEAAFDVVAASSDVVAASFDVVVVRLFAFLGFFLDAPNRKMS